MCSTASSFRLNGHNGKEKKKRSASAGRRKNTRSQMDGNRHRRSAGRFRLVDRTKIYKSNNIRQIITK